MKRIKDIDRREQSRWFEPGTVLSELHEAVEGEGLSSTPRTQLQRRLCARRQRGGELGRAARFKYGVTRDYVLGIEAFLIGGQRLAVGRRTKKGTTGYDLTALLFGSEGTLAVFGDLTLRLIPRPEGLMTLMALFDDELRAAAAVEEITGRGLVPRCLEFFDSTTLQAVRDAGSPLMPAARAMLLIEVDGDTAACESASLGVADACEPGGDRGARGAGAAQRERNGLRARR
jgi:glycolate oxidase